MRADTFLKLPIETVDGETLAPHRSLRSEWPRIFVLYVVCPFHSIGVSHEDRSALF